MDDLREAIREASETLVRATGLSVRALFSDRRLDEPGVLPAPDTQRAAGIVEGAAIALGLTVNELLDELDYPYEDEDL